jgi:hypothetical protein
MIKKSEAIKIHLDNTSSDVARLYSDCMEVQVMVAQDEGIRVVGEFNSRSFIQYQSPEDPQEKWKNFRIPLVTNEGIIDNDNQMGFSLRRHAEGIGCTGWDYKNKMSRWVGFDFDSIVNHKAGISQEALNEVLRELSEVPYVEIYTSTSGNGYHAYIFIEDEFVTESHDEHASLARSILTLLSAETGYNFHSKVDCVGSILWLWHRKQEGTNGLKLIKKSTQKLQVDSVPRNWKEHLSVVTGKTKRIKAVGDEEISLSNTIRDLTLENPHKMVLKWFTHSAEHEWWWDTDSLMLVCHTLDLKKCHEELELKGLFETLSSGSSEKNCFCFPQKGGEWVVRRFGKSVREHHSWTLDLNGWSKTIFNQPLNYQRAMIHSGGLEDSKKRFVFNSPELLGYALKLIDIDFLNPEELLGRITDIMYKEDIDRLIIRTQLKKAIEMNRLKEIVT